MSSVSVITLEAVEEQPGVFLWVRDVHLEPGEYSFNCVIPDDIRFEPIKPYLSRMNAEKLWVTKAGNYRVGSSYQFSCKETKQ